MRAILIVLVAAAAGVGVFWAGGFDPVPQWTFAGLAGAAGLAALAWRRGTIRSAPVAALLAIAVLQALSAAWAIDSTSSALRAAALTAAYAALAVAASGQAARSMALALAATAGVTGLMGLTSAALFSTVYAEQVEGAWRPEGPFGYPPALALVQVFALPVLLRTMARSRGVVAGLAAGGSAVAAGVLVLTANRTSIGLAALVLGIALAIPEQTVAARRPVVAGAIALMVAAGVASYELRGGWVPRYANAGAGSAVSAVALVVALGIAWVLIRPRLSNSLLLARTLTRRRLLAAGVIALVVAVGVGLVSTGALSARRFPSHQGFTHGRSWMWSAAYHTAVKRPLYGYGAGSFYEATVSRQPGHGRVTRFAHDLPLELAVETGIAGFLLGLALYVVAGWSLWRARGSPELWLLGPAVAAFFVSNLVDWSWHLAGLGALFALALGGLLNAPRRSVRP